MGIIHSCYLNCLSFFFFKQKTAYEMRISDWSSDVCSSDLMRKPRRRADYANIHPNDHVNRSQSTNDAYATAVRLATHAANEHLGRRLEIGRAACRERVWQYV